MDFTEEKRHRQWVTSMCVGRQRSGNTVLSCASRGSAPLRNTRCGPGRSYNQAREDFASEREYNDYLEEVEDLSALPCLETSKSSCSGLRLLTPSLSVVLSLGTKAEAAATKAKIQAYAVAHADRIVAARVRKVCSRTLSHTSSRCYSAACC
jgi:hypothetical protein